MTDIPTPPQPQPTGDLLEWVVGQYLSTKIQKAHILNQNGANLVYNHGRDVAQKLGLDPSTITPFPAAHHTEVTVEKPEPSSLLKTAGIAAALVLGGAGTAIVAQQVLDPDRLPQTRQVDPTPVVGETSEIGFTVR